jgi:hypothetical protein
MAKKLSSANAKSATRNFIAVMMLCIISFALLMRAFHAAELTPDQRIILDYCFALLGGGAGFLFGGVVLDLTSLLGPNLKLTIRALGGSALFVLLIFHPLFPSGAQPEKPSGGPPTILNPAPSSVVGQMIKVQGHSEYQGWHHYVVVTGIVAGGDIVQDTSMDLSSAGELLGTATIGNAAVGEGEPYFIRIVASRTPIAPGPLVPRKGFIFSDAVNVTRSFRSKGAN